MKNSQIDKKERSEILERIRGEKSSAFKRTGAYLLDAIIITFLFIFISAALNYLEIEFIGLPSELTLIAEGFIPVTPSYLFTLSFFSSIHLVYFVLLESDKGIGSSLGKSALSLKVVNTHGLEISITNSFIRNVFRLLWPVPFIAFEILLFTDSLVFPNLAYIFGIIMVIDLLLIIKDGQRIGDKQADTYVVNEKTYEEIFNDYWKDEGTQDTIEPTPNR
ncbi:MAG: RDD family protein [Thermoplasmata archaeon]